MATSSSRNDLAKCRGEHCPVRSNCQRYMRLPGERQTWLVVPQWQQGDKCRHYDQIVKRVLPNADSKEARFQGER